MMSVRKICLLLFIVMIIRGVNFHVASIALNHLNPISVNALRFLVGFLPLIFIRLFSKTKHHLQLSDYVKLSAFGLAAVFLPNFLFFKGVDEGSLLTGAILVALSPITTVILSIIFLKSSLKSGQWIALIFGCIGAIITIIAGSNLDTNISFRGNLWFVIFHFVMATNPVIIKKYFNHYNTLAITIVSTGTTFIASFLFAGKHLIQSEALQNTELWLAIAYMGLLTTAISFWIWNKGIQLIGPEKTSLFLNLVPVFTFISGLFLNKAWNYGQLFGGILVIIAVVINFYIIRISQESYHKTPSLFIKKKPLPSS